MLTLLQNILLHDEINIIICIDTYRLAESLRVQQNTYYVVLMAIEEVKVFRKFQ